MKAFLKWFVVGLVIILITGLVLMSIDKFAPGVEISAEVFVVLVGIVLSATWTFMPGLRVQFAALEDYQKSIVNLVLMIILAVLMFVFTCTNWSPIPGVVCSLQGAKNLGTLVFLAIVGNQITYVASPQPKDVKAVKAIKAAKLLKSVQK